MDAVLIRPMCSKLILGHEDARVLYNDKALVLGASCHANLVEVKQTLDN
jgi:hypothetical protein